MTNRHERGVPRRSLQDSRAQQAHLPAARELPRQEVEQAPAAIALRLRAQASVTTILLCRSLLLPRRNLLQRRGKLPDPRFVLPHLIWVSWAVSQFRVLQRRVMWRNGLPQLSAPLRSRRQARQHVRSRPSRSPLFSVRTHHEDAERMMTLAINLRVVTPSPRGRHTPSRSVRHMLSRSSASALSLPH